MNVEEFVPVELEQIISTPRKVELLMELGVRGFRSDKLVKAKVTWVAENNYLEHQLNVQVTHFSKFALRIIETSAPIICFLTKFEKCRLILSNQKAQISF